MSAVVTDFVTSVAVGVSVRSRSVKVIEPASVRVATLGDAGIHINDRDDRGVVAAGNGDRHVLGVGAAVGCHRP